VRGKWHNSSTLRVDRADS